MRIFHLFFIIFHHLILKHHTILVYLISLLSLFKPYTIGLRSGCPARPLIRPCTCQEKTKGLDVSCEGARIEQLREALENLGQTGQVMWYLKLRKNQMPTFPSFLLDGVDVIHLVALHSNMTSIDDSAFVGLGEQIESLDLSQNGLTEIPSKSLELLTSLLSLSLNYNRIEALKSYAFKGLISLLRLSIYGNKIKSIDLLAFHGIGGNLTRINLGGNLLPSIPSQSLQNVTALQRLQLHENKIKSIESREFNGIAAAESLDVLNLAVNLLEELKEKAFSNLGALNSLDLEGNYISRIHINAFEGIEDSLEWLKLGENRLDQIPSFALRNLTKLRQLDLRGNNISYIHEDSLKNFGTNLKFIYLQKNSIKMIEIGALDNLMSLEWLYLYSNQLSTIQFEILSPILDSLSVLDVHDNPYICDCEIVWFGEWLRTGKGVNVVNLPKETKCYYENSPKKVPVSEIAQSITGCKSFASTFGLLIVTKLSLFYYFISFIFINR